MYISFSRLKYQMKQEKVHKAYHKKDCFIFLMPFFIYLALCVPIYLNACALTLRFLYLENYFERIKVGNLDHINV